MVSCDAFLGIFAFGPFIQKKLLETRVLDKINFFSLQNKAFGPFFEFILSKTWAPDRINFFNLQTKVFQESLSYYPIWAGDSR